MPFSQQLAVLNRGAEDRELTEKLSQVVAAVLQYRKPGKISIELTLSVDASAQVTSAFQAVKIQPKIDFKIPQPGRRVDFVFANIAGDIIRDDPEQRSFDLRDVSHMREATDRDLEDLDDDIRDLDGQPQEDLR